MEMEVRHEGDIIIVSVAGSVDALTADELLSALMGHIDEGRSQMVVDMQDVSYTSSAGLRTIALALKASRRKGGDLRLAGLQKGVHRVFEMSGFDNILEIHESVEGAVESFGVAG